MDSVGPFGARGPFGFDGPPHPSVMREQIKKLSLRQQVKAEKVRGGAQTDRTGRDRGHCEYVSQARESWRKHTGTSSPTRFPTVAGATEILKQLLHFHNISQVLVRTLSTLQSTPSHMYRLL